MVTDESLQHLQYSRRRMSGATFAEKNHKRPHLVTGHSNEGKLKRKATVSEDTVWSYGSSN